MPKSKRAQRTYASNSSSKKRPPAGNNPASAQPAGRSASPGNRSSATRSTPSATSQTRTPLGTGAARRRRQQLPWWRQSRSITVGGILLGAAAIIVLFAVLARMSAAANASNTKPATASLVSAVTAVTPQVSDAVGTGGLPNPFHALPSTSPLNGPSGKPEVLYLGAEYCPFCAAERWSLIIALSRFGTFSNLHTTTSSGTDNPANVPTFTFFGSSYQSQYVDFVPVEQATRDPGTPLQTPTDAQQALATKYDAAPYVPATAASSIPFVDFGNQYVTVGSGYPPTVITGYTWDQIGNALDNPASPITKNVVGNANYITAGICKLTNDQPATACSSPAIQQIVGQLPKGQ